MTTPRAILPGKTYLVTRRCTQRQFLLRPSSVTNQNVAYCLALAAEQTGILLHAACVMSNHWHGVLTDPEARLPEFLEIFHRLVAKVQNASLGRWENLWASSKPSIVELVTEEAVLKEMAYTLANPTLGRLVKNPSEWPGLISRRFGERRVIDMPDIYFNENSNLPDTVELKFCRPPIYSTRTDIELQIMLDSAVSRLVKQTKEEVRRQRTSFLGREEILRQSFTASPNSLVLRRKLNPRVAASSSTTRRAAITALLAFVRAYRTAWNDWRNGNHSVIFPYGTYALRRFAGVTCHPPPAPA